MTTGTGEVEAAAPARSRVLAVLRVRDFRMLLASFTTSRMGDFLYVVALAAHLYTLTGSAGWVSAGALARFVPMTFLSPLAGVVADRYDRRRVMAAGDLVQLLTMSGLAVTALLGGPAQLVVVLVVVSACAATLSTSSASAMVAATVPEDQLAAANSLRSTIDQLAFVVGPAAGGLLLLLGAPAAAFAVNAATFAVSAAFLLAIRVRPAPREPGPRPSALTELREGVGAFLSDRTVAVLVACGVASMAVYGVEVVVLVLVSSTLLGTGTEGLGWLLAASGIGGLLGALGSARVAALARPRLVIAVCTLATGVPLALLAVVRVPLLAYAVLLVEGAAVLCLDVIVETALQRAVPGEVLGRVSGLAISLVAAGTALGTLLAPVLVAGVGLVPTLVLGGLVPVGLATAGLLTLRGLDDAADAGARALAPRVALLERLRLFDGADRATLERVAATVAEERVAAGTVLLAQGAPADDLFVLVSGSFEVEREEGGVARRVNEMAAPDYAGEIGLVEGVPRTATVRASTDAVVWRVPGAVFLDAVGGGPVLSPSLLGGISARLARTPGALRR